MKVITKKHSHIQNESLYQTNFRKAFLKKKKQAKGSVVVSATPNFRKR